MVKNIKKDIIRLIRSIMCTICVFILVFVSLLAFNIEIQSITQFGSILIIITSIILSSLIQSLLDVIEEDKERWWK